MNLNNVMWPLLPGGSIGEGLFTSRIMKSSPKICDWTLNSSWVHFRLGFTSRIFFCQTDYGT